MIFGFKFNFSTEKAQKHPLGALLGSFLCIFDTLFDHLVYFPPLFILVYYKAKYIPPKTPKEGESLLSRYVKRQIAFILNTLNIFSNPIPTSM